MRCKLIALDMDGTVLNSDKVLTPAAAQAIQTACDRGCEVVFASGRCLAEIRPYLPLTPGVRYLITHGGGCVLDLQGSPIAETVLDEETVRRVTEALSALDHLTVLYIGDRLYADRRTLHRLDAYHCREFAPLYDMTSAWTDDFDSIFASHRGEIRKMNFYFRDEAAVAHAKALLSEFPLCVSSGIPTDLEIQPAEADKGSALRRLCQHLSIPLRDTAAVGDSENDLSMLRTAGLAVAMGNALPCIRTAADLVVADCDHDGSAQAIASLLPAIETHLKDR